MRGEFTRTNILTLSAYLVDNYKDLLAHIASDPSAEYQKQLADVIFNSRLRNVANDGKSLDRLKTALLNRDGEKWASESGDSKLLELYNALSQNHILIASLRNLKQNTIRGMGLRKPRDVSTVDNIPTIELNYSTLVANAKKKLEYPHRNTFYALSGEVRTKWETHFEGPRADNRISRKPVHVLDLGKFQHILETDQSAIFVDNKTQAPLLIVIRSFIRDTGILDFFNEVIKDNVDARRDVRVSLQCRSFRCWLTLSRWMILAN
jgi:hypothetical protein